MVKIILLTVEKRTVKTNAHLAIHTWQISVFVVYSEPKFHWCQTISL